MQLKHIFINLLQIRMMIVAPCTTKSRIFILSAFDPTALEQPNHLKAIHCSAGVVYFNLSLIACCWVNRVTNGTAICLRQIIIGKIVIGATSAPTTAGWT
nr:hypothetical protein [Acidovorax sp. Root219]